MIFMKVLVQGIINSVISVYVPQCGLDNSNRDNFYGSLISFISVRGEGNFSHNRRLNDYFGSNAEDYEDQQGNNGYGDRNKEGERILKFYAAMNMSVITFWNFTVFSIGLICCK